MLRGKGRIRIRLSDGWGDRQVGWGCACGLMRMWWRICRPGGKGEAEILGGAKSVQKCRVVFWRPRLVRRELYAADGSIRPLCIRS